MSRNNRRDYTEDFKADAISLALRSSSIRKAADSLGLPESTLTTWVKKASKKSISSGEVIDLSEEIKMLRKENARLKEEKEILKKAATYFAKESK